MTEPRLKVPTAEMQRNSGFCHDKALTQPMAATRNGRSLIAMNSIQEYKRLKRRDC